MGDGQQMLEAPYVSSRVSALHGLQQVSKGLQGLLGIRHDVEHLHLQLVISIGIDSRAITSKRIPAAPEPPDDKPVMDPDEPAEPDGARDNGAGATT